MRTILMIAVVGALVLGAGCANDPQYVMCGSTDTMDTCKLDSQDGSGMGDAFAVSGSLHVPVMPENSDQTKTREALQKTLPDDVVVPIYRLDEYDLSVDWSVTNMDGSDTSARVALNGANEAFAWQPSLIMPASDESPPPPSLAGDIPFAVPAHGTVSGEFTEDELLAAAVDLDMISRGNINMYAATLVDNKDAANFQPVTAEQPPPPGSDDPPMQTPVGDAVPRSAFRQIVRVDIALKPADSGVHLVLEYSLRVRPQVAKTIDDMGMNAPAGDVMIYDPAPFVPAYTP